MRHETTGTLRHYRETGIFFRVHWDSCPAFSAENAESRPWGDDEAVPLPGYSCCDSADALRHYFASRGEPAADDKVVIFWGVIAGYGPDGEPLVTPCEQMRPRWTTYSAIQR